MAMAMTASIALCSCGSDGDDEPANDIPADAVYDIVTMVSTSSKGTVFTMQCFDDSELITYDAPYDFTTSEHMKPGRRMLICYKRTDGATYTSGKIKLYGYSSMANTEQDVKEGEASDYDNWHLRKMQVSALWRTGHYVNLQASLYVFKALKPETFVLVADKATIGSDYPELYVAYSNAEGNDGDNVYPVKASFDIDAIWSLPTCKGVVIYYNDGTGNVATLMQKQM